MRAISFCLALLFIAQIQCNNYDPHYPHDGEGLWFEGWYTRIVDFTNQRAFATLFCSYCLNGTNCNNMQDLPGYLGLVFQNFGSKFNVIETYPNATYLYVGPNNQPITGNPDFSSPPQFQWKAEEGAISQSQISINMPGGYSFQAQMSNPVFWNPSDPGEGPEGIVQSLPLQQHWFVYSLGSQVQYSFSTPDGSTYSGSGYAHQEKNWGSTFPIEWVWSEGTSADNQYHFALSGGTVPVGPINMHAWLVGYRSPSNQWDFRPQDVPTLYTPYINGCNGTFELQATYLAETLKIWIEAPMDTFTPLAIPSENGMEPNGCVESYAAHAIVQLWKWGSMIEQYEFTNVGLEFGGGYLCNSDTAQDDMI